jgi:hypothetical protein
MSERITRLRMRGGTAAEWTTANPILLAREFGIETDTRRMKMGDGTTAWSSLAYFLAASDVRGQTSRATDATIAGAAAGTFRGIGAAGTLDTATTSGLIIGTTDTFALRNPSASAVLLDVQARASIITANNHTLGLRLAVNGTTIAETETRLISMGASNETPLTTRWTLSLPAAGEVSMHVTNFTDTGTMTFKRGAIVAQEIHV